MYKYIFRFTTYIQPDYNVICAVSYWFKKCKKCKKSQECSGPLPWYTTRILEMLGLFFYLNKMKTKKNSNHMSKYFIHNKT